jgi:hypothetical protein
MSNFIIDLFSLAQGCKDEGDLEYLMNASADKGLTDPRFGWSKGSGKIKAADADNRNANTNYHLYKTDSGFYIMLNPLRNFLREMPKALEYRINRKRNPQLIEDAIGTEFGIARMAMIGKAVLGTWVDPEQERIFHEQTRAQRLLSFKSQFAH